MAGWWSSSPILCNLTPLQQEDRIGRGTSTAAAFLSEQEWKPRTLEAFGMQSWVHLLLRQFHFSMAHA